MRNILIAAAAAFALPVAASATPVQFLGNGHWYDFVPASPTSAAATMDWLTAKADAASLSLNGQQGYLATSTSAAEEAFIHSVAAGRLSWIDGADDASQGTSEGVWIFTGGPEAGLNFFNASTGPVNGAYTNWTPGEPNNAGGAENFIELNWASATGWNDAGVSTPQTRANGFVVEFNDGHVSSGAPEPAAWALMLLGFGGMGVAMRRRRLAAA
jgi:hypothetical protein